MAFGVFIHRADSIYEDRPAGSYQFPPQYRSRAEATVGDWILYYEPRKVPDTRGYFALAKVGQIIPDPSAPGMYLAMIEPGSYIHLPNPVPFARSEGLVQSLAAAMGPGM
jgi:putative restriction endonuclease